VSPIKIHCVSFLLLTGFDLLERGDDYPVMIGDCHIFVFNYFCNDTAHFCSHLFDFCKEAILSLLTLLVWWVCNFPFGILAMFVSVL